MILDKTAAALYTTLNAGTALTALLARTDGIYDTQAPDGAVLPYVVFSHQAGGPENVDPNNLEQNVWYVRAYDDTRFKDATEIFEQIDTLLNKVNISITGFNTLRCVREENVRILETLPNKTKIWGVGGMYRIRTG